MECQCLFSVSQKIDFDIPCEYILSPVECQCLFSGKNKTKHIINMASAEFAQRVVKINMQYLSTVRLMFST